MAEPLKNSYGVEIPGIIAGMISPVFPGFNRRAFIDDTLEGYEPLSLMERGRRIARTLRRHLPEDFDDATGILIRSLNSPTSRPEGSMASFLYLPHTLFIAEFGLQHFETSMKAQHRLTRIFTAEFSIRPFLMQHTEATLARLEKWTADPDIHVRRLVSEGTRPRLPWASRLRNFQDDPLPVLKLLELLKDDPELYVRRSVANNLNDIGKDHPELLVETAARWIKNASPDRNRLVRHALRSAVKRGDPDALSLLGYDRNIDVSVNEVKILPEHAIIGNTLKIAFQIRNTSSKRQYILADFQIHYIKARGKSNPKVFKLKELDLAPGDHAELEKRISLADMTTRKHYPGLHRIDLLLNGNTIPLGKFELSPG